MLKTPLCDLLGIEKPVFQGGMAWIADASLASAVSEAGGLGIIAAMNADANWLRDQIYELRTKTDKPFGVNVMLMSPFVDEVAQVVIDEQVPVVVTGAGNPTKYMKAWGDAGIKVIPVVASVALARLVARRGATAVVAEGTESGGHIGETSTMALVPQVVDAVDIPVVAAGGIADGRGVAAAFMLGAAGVQVGTRFLVANECTVSEQYKELVLKAGDTSTRATGRSTGHPVRALKSPFTNAYAKSEGSGASAEELGAMGTGALRKAAKDGNYEEGSFLCGQIAGMVNERQSAREIVDDLVDGAEHVLRAHGWRSVFVCRPGCPAPRDGRRLDRDIAGGRRGVRHCRRGAPGDERAVPERLQGGALADREHAALRVRARLGCRRRPARARRGACRLCGILAGRGRCTHLCGGIRYASGF